MKVLTRKTAIWSRATELPGQKVPLPQPVEMDSAASCLIQAAAQWVVGTLHDVAKVLFFFFDKVSNDCLPVATK